MTRRIHERFMRSFQNPTKLSIMLLLTQKRSMTVTQMSSYIGVTKASLYHSVVELVNDGLVSEPMVQVKKHYIEKYYHLNTLAFKAIDPFELQRRFNQGASSVEFKDLLEAFFTSFSLYFQIYAHEIGKTSQEKFEQLMREVKEERLLLWSLNLDDGAYERELKAIRNLMKKSAAAMKTSKSNAFVQRDEYFSEADNRIFIIAVPRFMTSSDC